MAIIDMIKLKGQFWIAKDNELHDKIVVALAGRLLCMTAGEVKAEIGDEWDAFASSEQFYELWYLRKMNTRYVIIYYAPVDRNFVLAEHGLSAETVQEFFNRFRMEDEERVSWATNQPEFFVEETVRAFPNGVLKYDKDGFSGALHFMLIPLSLWQEIPLQTWHEGT